MDKEEIKKLIIYPVRYEPMGQYIFDAEDNIIANVRGWGRLQYLPDPEATQDEIGRFIAEGINKILKPKCTLDVCREHKGMMCAECKAEYVDPLKK